LVVVGGKFRERCNIENPASALRETKTGLCLCENEAIWLDE